jgi:hypothetical protein
VQVARRRLAAMVKALIALIPSAGVLLLFVVVVRAMLEGDRRERAAQARWEKQHARSAGQSQE